MRFLLHARVWLCLALVAGAGMAFGEKGTKSTLAAAPVPTAQNEFNSPTTFYEYDWTTNSFA